MAKRFVAKRNPDPDHPYLRKWVVWDRERQSVWSYCNTRKGAQEHAGYLNDQVEAGEAWIAA